MNKGWEERLAWVPSSISEWCGWQRGTETGDLGSPREGEPWKAADGQGLEDLLVSSANRGELRAEAVEGTLLSNVTISLRGVGDGQRRQGCP